MHLLAARGVHLLADDLLDLAHGSPAQRQVAIDAGSELLDEPGAQQKLMAGRLRLGRSLAERLREELCETHGTRSLRVWTFDRDV